MRGAFDWYPIRQVDKRHSIFYFFDLNLQAVHIMNYADQAELDRFMQLNPDIEVIELIMPDFSGIQEYSVP